VRWAPVGELGEVRMGKQLSPASRLFGQQYPYLRVANVFNGRIDYSDVKTMGFTSAERETYGLRRGDILLNEGQTLELVGRSSLYDGPDGAYCFQNTLVRFRPGPDVLPEYAQLVFSQWLATGVFSAIAKKTTSIAHLGGERFAKLPFPLVSLAHQARAVEIISSFEESEVLAREESAKLQLLITALTDDLIVNSGATDKFQLGSLARITGGVTLGRETPEGMSTELPYLRVANVQDGVIDCTQMKTVRVLNSEVNKYRLRKNDLLLTEGGDIDKLGRGAVWDGRIDPCLHQNHVFRVRCGPRIEPHFLAAYTASAAGRRYFLSIAKQTTNLASINSSQLKAMPIPCPPIPQQQKAIQIIGEMERERDHLQRELAKLRTVKSEVAARVLTRELQKPQGVPM
jgi:type I restriction enzyme S subunit